MLVGVRILPPQIIVNRKELSMINKFKESLTHPKLPKMTLKQIVKTEQEVAAFIK